MSDVLKLGPDTWVRCEAIDEVACGGRMIAISVEAEDAIEGCHRLLEEEREKGALIYGLTTGFGPLANRQVELGELERLQKNLVYHLASGVGEPFGEDVTRAMMACRAVCLARGRSAVRLETLQLLVRWLQDGLVPVVPRYGSVGASGDLTPLAHVALAMMGEGEVFEEGRAVAASSVLEKRGIQPLRLSDRDGLALVNGTSATTAMAALAQVRAQRALDWAVGLSAAFCDVLGGHAQAYDEVFGEVRPHPGQVRVAAALREALADSARVERGFGESRGLPQDPYTLRCVPQMLGAVDDALGFHREVVEREINAVSDNPIFDVARGQVRHGGNFFGQHVAMASDLLNTQLVTMAVLAERQCARLMDEALSGLPAFLQWEDVGVQSGMMGAQVTASSLVAQMRGQMVALSVQSMPTNGNNQDVNPMATLAALRSLELVERLSEVLGILALGVAQAVRKIQAHGQGGFAEATVRRVERVLEVASTIEADRPLYGDIRAIAGLVVGC
ncbi:aromatic amino acid lyase [Lujinxingia vulgaris]|uniref:Aromatic amino acid lyase n=1 Tax=Lujinxingia vulgaris TaxID=2600176 RepID=A0A5C6X6D3_9DELT|nr:aromatic amino acid ammonia-lyase [Lujinxingia vulgaris]TXD34268.1 aromatic amino acid lyase [Lujinxingia vulgaris]